MILVPAVKPQVGASGSSLNQRIKEARSSAARAWPATTPHAACNTRTHDPGISEGIGLANGFANETRREEVIHRAKLAMLPKPAQVSEDVPGRARRPETHVIRL